MTATPTIISGVVTDVTMNIISSTPSFTLSNVTSNTDSPHSVFAEDLDNDGDLDVVAAYNILDKIIWYENDGAETPSWSPHTITSSADGAYGVYAADIDGDGDIDVLSAAYNDNEIAWYENDGNSDPSFTKNTIATTAQDARDVFAIDLDNDGDLDVLSASFDDDTIAWYENDGGVNPSWTANDIYTNADGAIAVFAIDLDGDGDVDIVSASAGDDTITWYENDGQSNPSWTAEDIITNATLASDIHASDIDRDGDIDILYSAQNGDEVAWLENDGGANPSWTKILISTQNGPTAVYAADMDGDGDEDVLTGFSGIDTVAWYENDGASNPGWTKHDIDTTANDPESIYAADIDGNGSLDIVAAINTDDNINWYKNYGNAYIYTWDVDSGGTPTNGNYIATVSGEDSNGNTYSGTDSITFILDTTAPTVTLTDTDPDNLVAVTDTVTITAAFSEAMAATPTISITGIVTNVVMTQISGTNSYTYLWDTSSGTLSEGTYAATVSGSDIIGNAYVAGTQSITFTVDKTAPTVSLSKSTTNATLPYTGTVTITATFSESMANSPTISVGGVSNAVMTSTSSSVWEYNWTINNGSWMTANTTTTTFATVSGTDIVGNAYSGTTSISFTIDNSPLQLLVLPQIPTEHLLLVIPFP